MAASIAAVFSPPFAPSDVSAPYRSGVVLLGFRSHVSLARQRAIEREVGASGVERLGPDVRPAVERGVLRAQPIPLLLHVPRGRELAAVQQLRGERGVAYAEPDYLMTADAAPNDPSFALQWADNNTGQSIPTQNANEELGAPASGTPGADERTLPAWNVSTGSGSIVIGETDTGIDYTHPDLIANVWNNPAGVGKCTAGAHGYNVLTIPSTEVTARTSPGSWERWATTAPA
jgi:hypothetical protein